MNLPRRAAAAVVALLALAGPSGCSSPDAAPPPDRTVVLGDDLNPAGPELPAPAFTVRLRVHERFAVQHTISDHSQTWMQTTRGSRTVLGRGKEIDLTGCPPRVAGCSFTADDVYTARAPGRTTVVWTFVTRGCASELGAPLCMNVPAVIRVVVR